MEILSAVVTQSQSEPRAQLLNPGTLVFHHLADQMRDVKREMASRPAPASQTSLEILTLDVGLNAYSTLIAQQQRPALEIIAWIPVVQTFVDTTPSALCGITMHPAVSFVLDLAFGCWITRGYSRYQLIHVYPIFLSLSGRV